MIYLLAAIAIYLIVGFVFSVIAYWDAPLLYPIQSHILFTLIWPCALIPIPQKYLDHCGRKSWP